MEGHIHGMMYMGIMIAQLLRRKLYAWYNAYRKKENAKVRNYNLRCKTREIPISGIRAKS